MAIIFEVTTEALLGHYSTVDETSEPLINDCSSKPRSWSTTTLSNMGD